MAEYKGIPMKPDMFDHLKGASTGVRNMDNNWRDISLYALSIGCKRPDTPYFFERDRRGLHAFPTFSRKRSGSGTISLPCRVLCTPFTGLGHMKN